MPTDLTQEKVFALYNEDEMSKFRDETELARFVKSLDGQKQKLLTGWLSIWRKNMVAKFIDSHPGSWQTQPVSIDRIIVNRINRNVDLHLERCGFRVNAIAQDQEIRGLSEFRQHSEIARTVFLAERFNDDFRLLDGNHRAIVLAIGGCKELILVFPV